MKQTIRRSDDRMVFQSKGIHRRNERHIPGIRIFRTDIGGSIDYSITQNRRFITAPGIKLSLSRQRITIEYRAIAAKDTHEIMNTRRQPHGPRDKLLPRSPIPGIGRDMLPILPLLPLAYTAAGIVSPAPTTAIRQDH